MYHCHVLFYYTGRQSQLFETVKGITPSDGFVYEYTESAVPREELASRADVILANLLDMDAEKTVRDLAAWKRPEAELILLAGQDQAAELTGVGTGEALSAVTDIWTVPMTEDELRFRFLRWQKTYKLQKDFWQTGQFLESAINGTPDLIWFKDKNGIHEKVNDSFCNAVNKSKTQVQGRGHAYIWDVEADDPACIESERIVMESRKTCVSEETIQTGGGERVLTTYKSPLYDLDGSVMGTVGVGIDVTQEHNYARELLKKNQTLEMLFTTMDCGMVCHTLDGTRVISINRAALNILGYDSTEEMLEDGFFVIANSVLDEDKPKLQKSIRSLQSVGDSASIEYRVRHKNGEIVHVLGSYKLVEENGEIYCQRFLLDRTAQKLQEEEERKREERRQMELIQALSIDYNMVYFVELDTREGRALRIGDCKEKLLGPIFDGGLPFWEALERYIEAGVYEEDREPLRRALSCEQLKEALMERTVCNVNYRTTCCGELRYFQMKAVRAGDWGKKHEVVIGFRSVDEETRSEREQRALLENALSQANRANKAKSVFLSDMSHDIRTPLNAIIGFTSLSLTHIGNQEQVREYLKKIMTSGNHLLSLINDVLDMSHIESGKIHLEEEACSLSDIMHELQNIIQADVHAKQLNLCMDAVDIHNEEIYCDRLRLNQVLLNLLSNAVKYTGAGGTVSMRVTEKPGSMEGFATYEFLVKDTGIGMSEEFVSRIFAPFEREYNTTISGVQGTGLGMAITKNIVDIMNGTIEVTSRQGEGTECVVTLPLRINGEKQTPQIIPELSGARALVVDDDFNTCDNVSSMLQQIGLRAEWTLSGKEAVLRTRQALTRDDPYCVHIIDWLLPDMNGIEVARRVRQESGKNVPIIVLTAYDWTDIEDEAREAGVTAFCSKPLFLSELRSCLYSIVSADSEKEHTGEKKALRTGRILLAEDNDLNQEIAVSILSEAGFTVDVAENGQVALDMISKAEAGYYQVVLMDVQMPVMNGYEATKAIRRLEEKELASIPILAMTANAFEEDKQAAMQSGMNGHIAKPIDIDKLMETLDQVLK